MALSIIKFELDDVVDMAMKQVLDGTTVNDVSIREWIDRITTGEYKPVKRGYVERIKAEECCSNCHERLDYYLTGEVYYYDYPKFCPNCGADMRGDENDKP